MQILYIRLFISFVLVAMAENTNTVSSLPGDLTTEPTGHLVFNSPFLMAQKIQIRLTNASENRIGWILKSTNTRRFTIGPTCGTLSAGEQVLLDVSCQPFDYQVRTPGRDRVTFEWLDAPAGQDEFRRDWFLTSGVMRRKVMPIEYNL